MRVSFRKSAINRGRARMMDLGEVQNTCQCGKTLLDHFRSINFSRIHGVLPCSPAPKWIDMRQIEVKCPLYAGIFDSSRAQSSGCFHARRLIEKARGSGQAPAADMSHGRHGDGTEGWFAADRQPLESVVSVLVAVLAALVLRRLTYRHHAHRRSARRHFI